MSLFVRYQPIAIGGGGGGGVSSIGPFGTTPNADGGDITGTTLTLEPADGTHPGGVSILAQTFGGNKTFLGSISAANLSGTNTGDVTLGTADGLSLVGQVLSLALSSTSTTGALSSTDWNTFNNKQPALTFGSISDVGTDGITVTNGSNSTVGPNVTLSQHVADATHNGYLSSADWVTFNAKQPAGSYITSVAVATANGFAGSSSGTTTPTLTLTTTVTGILQGNGTSISAATTGNLTDAGTDGITITGGTGAVLGSGASIAQHVADSTHNGYLSSTDWSTFNSKQATLSLSAFGSTPNANGLSLTGAVLNMQPFDATHPGGVAASGGGTTNFLRADGTWALPNTGFTNPMTTLGDIIYENATPTPARLAGNTTSTKNFLTQTGNGTISAAPAWGTLAAADLPTITLTGDVTGAASGGSVATTAAATQANITSLSNTAGVAIHGTNTNNSASAGFVGEYIESASLTNTIFATTSTNQNAVSISLTAGDWDVTGTFDFGLNASTTTLVEANIVTTSLASGTLGRSRFQSPPPTSVYDTTITMPCLRFSLSGTTTVFAVVNAIFSAGHPQFNCVLSARRVR